MIHFVPGADDAASLKGALLAYMLERVNDPARPRLGPLATDTSPRTDLYIGTGVIDITKELRRRLGRGIQTHEVVAALWQLQKRGFVVFHASSQGPSANVPTRIKLTQRAMAIKGDVKTEVMLADRDAVWEKADTASVVRDIAASKPTPEEAPVAVADTAPAGEADELAPVAEPEGTTVAAGSPPATVRVKPEALLARHEVLLAAGRGVPPEMQAAVDAARAEPSPAAEADPVTAPPVPGERFPLWLLGVKYPEIAKVYKAEARVQEAVRLLRLAGQEDVATLALEGLSERLPLAREVSALLAELVVWGLAEEESTSTEGGGPADH